MSSKLVSSSVHAIYYDEEEDKTYIFGTHATDGFVGFCADGPVVELTDPQVILGAIQAEKLEVLRQLKSIEETANGRKTQATGSAPQAAAVVNAEQPGQVGGGVSEPGNQGG